MVDYLVTGATDPTSINGVYKEIGWVEENVLLFFNGVYYLRIEQDIEEEVAEYFAAITDLGYNHEYFFSEDTYSTQLIPNGAIFEENEASGNVIVTQLSSNKGTLGTAEIDKDYIDKAYMGADGVAVDVS